MLYSIFIVIIALVLIPIALSIWKQATLAKRTKVIIIFSMAAVMVSGSALFYHYLGRPDVPQKLVAYDEHKRELAFSIQQWSEKVKENSKNAENWAELGSLFAQAEQYSAAENAFKQAVLLSKGNPDYILLFAKAQIAVANGKVTEDARKGLEMVLKLDPDNAEAKRILTLTQ